MDGGAGTRRGRRDGVVHGADLALIKGRATTCAPLLLRSGFTNHGQDRC